MTRRASNGRRPTAASGPPAPVRRDSSSPGRAGVTWPAPGRGRRARSISASPCGGPPRYAPRRGSVQARRPPRSTAVIAQKSRRAATGTRGCPEQARTRAAAPSLPPACASRPGVSVRGAPGRMRRSDTATRRRQARPAPAHRPARTRGGAVPSALSLRRGRAGVEEGRRGPTGPGTSRLSLRGPAPAGAQRKDPPECGAAPALPRRRPARAFRRRSLRAQGRRSAAARSEAVTRGAGGAGAREAPFRMR